MAQMGFYYDNSRCTGCKTCEMACKDYKDLSADIAFRKVYDYEGGDWTVADDGTCTQTAFCYHLSLACNHCANPACVAACQTGAVYKDDTTGLVRVDADKCNGCGTCVVACPYGVPQIDPETSKMVKCDGCYDRVVAGLEPICVEACPLRAIGFGDIDEMRASYEDVVDSIAPMPDSPTEPSVIIKACPAAKEVGDTTGEIGNPLEVANVQAS